MTARRKDQHLLAAALVVILPGLAACQREEAKPPSPVRIVRTITVEKQPEAAHTIFTGHVEAQDRAALSFRIGGRMAERTVGIGATVSEGEVVARLDPENELNDLRSARAALTAAQGLLRKAENQFQRQSHLLERNVTTRADFELAEQGRTAARAQVDAAQARVTSAEDVVGFTTLKADAPGVVTRVGAEPGEVVTPGRMIVELARRDGRDAVFEVPADVIRSLTPNAPVRVALASDPGVTVSGRVREIAPQADPVTRTFRIRVGLSDPPPAFRLGSTVSGTIAGSDASVIAIPATALKQQGQEFGVWIVDPQKLTVSMRKLDIVSADPATALVGKGLSLGDIVVTAGVNQLRHGQQVRLTGTETR
ncbi:MULTISPECIES: efflux RND transporter periplasmic adaptor subunit [unclassified Chelatococcus]|uniref:efflux RND transporter periplasmic adaptor subunit n=1 Tax=unclassified Chelatococcus TaxID=2638111 RepID=UPI001BCD6187|nr:MULTISPECIES: efflux RND transporter periplasmic adaptor subunit [unclassified Chelatococcus]CAH1672079.1 RND family efflux transporter MFP subunit [Hyphomicrobiales bacterium]MBS7738546.1 efflux RND transporter periplasmic adaptor subunit [Chelatococcus sp. HY11]MBX3542950.1 efflux RND transporter periplasmic adaptor subunit [Chelatococcus sp.]MCO5076923.1 efflux RND transporter periplasmic adaptor subunit [Chelatococcus sp.]CAH1675692.1 RND family efflux transporter MFP subunit [Hyphomicr